MALNFRGGSVGLFPTSDASGQGLRTKTELQLRQEQQDSIPDIAPGEVILWERGEGQGENAKVIDTTVFALVETARWAGQSFTIGATSLNGDFSVANITMQLFRVGNPGTINLELTEVDGDGFPTGAALTTGTSNGNTLTTDSGGELRTIDITPVILKASTKYAFYIKCLSGGGSDYVNIKGQGNPGDYTEGAQISTGDSGTNWAGAGGDDCYFDIQGGGKFLITRTTNNDLYQAALTKVV